MVKTIWEFEFARLEIVKSVLRDAVMESEETWRSRTRSEVETEGVPANDENLGEFWNYRNRWGIQC